MRDVKVSTAYEGLVDNQEYLENQTDGTPSE
jgi:hypothetical protein